MKVFETSSSAVMPGAASLMEPAPSAPKSTLEMMLDAVRKRYERQKDDGAEPFLPPSPARPRGRGRPPSSARRPPSAGFKVGNGGGSDVRKALFDKKPDDGKNNKATISYYGAAAAVIHPADETVVDDAVSPDFEEQCSGIVADPTLSPHYMGDLIQEDKGDMFVCINHGATDVVDGQQGYESEINVGDERSLHDAVIVAPCGGDATDACALSPSASPSSSIARVGRRTPSQSSRSVSPPRSSSSSTTSNGSSRESEPEKRTKAAGVGKLLWGSTSCARAPVAAVAKMMLNTCRSSSARARARALEEETDQQPGGSPHHGSVKSVPGGGGGDAAEVSTAAAKASAASSVSRSGVVWRWLKKIAGRLRDARDVEETTKAGPRQRKIRSTLQPWIN